MWAWVGETEIFKFYYSMTQYYLYKFIEWRNTRQTNTFPLVSSMLLRKKHNFWNKKKENKLRHHVLVPTLFGWVENEKKDRKKKKLKEKKLIFFV